MVRKRMPTTRVKGVRLPAELWDEIEADAAERGVSANAEAARRIESAPPRQAAPGSRVRVQADTLDACVAATLALAGCGLRATQPPAKAEGGCWECAMVAPNDGDEG